MFPIIDNTIFCLVLICWFRRVFDPFLAEAPVFLPLGNTRKSKVLRCFQGVQNENCSEMDLHFNTWCTLKVLHTEKKPATSTRLDTLRQSFSFYLQVCLSMCDLLAVAGLLNYVLLCERVNKRSSQQRFWLVTYGNAAILD